MLRNRGEVPDPRGEFWRGLREQVEVAAAPWTAAKDSDLACSALAVAIDAPTWQYLGGFLDAAARFRFSWRHDVAGKLEVDYSIQVVAPEECLSGIELARRLLRAGTVEVVGSGGGDGQVDVSQGGVKYSWTLTRADLLAPWPQYVIFGGSLRLRLQALQWGSLQMLLRVDLAGLFQLLAEGDYNCVSGCSCGGDAPGIAENRERDRDRDKDRDNNMDGDRDTGSTVAAQASTLRPSYS